MKGRQLTGNVKLRPFKEAAASYESALVEFQTIAKTHEAKASRAFREARTQQVLSLNEGAGEAKQGIEETQQALQSWIAYDSWLQPDDACELIDASSCQLNSLRASVECRYQAIPWWRKAFWPDVSTLAQQQALRFLRQIQRNLDALQATAREGECVSRGQTMAVLGAVGIMKEETAASLESTYTAQKERSGEARRFMNETLAAILRQRQQAEAHLTKTLKDIRATLREALQPALSNLNERVERVRSEGSKVGISV